jgi:hypothetical protein
MYALAWYGEFVCQYHNTQLRLNSRRSRTIMSAGTVERRKPTGKIEAISLEHDDWRTLVCAEYGYQKGSSNTNS